ncbi:MAG TPA: sensor domain-containing diguanylate cyclase [Phycisphaerae bacterium]|nr:sensor domain-containing diguanylate cyclase [Phycisphaerae bacterium]
MAAAHAETEERRLAALKTTCLLDTPLEERFERITRLTCQLLRVPIAAVSLVDGSRQWFKSIHGADMTETPRGDSMCAHAILQEEALVVPNAREDARFRESALVCGSPHIAAYAGQSVRAPDGSRIGAVCAIDTRARSFTPEEMQMLRDMAAIAEAEISAAGASSTQHDLLAQLDAEHRRTLLDSLTRLWNREGILEVLDHQCAQAVTGGAPLAVLLADVDHFKRINDTCGHAAGDGVLREIGKRLLNALRREDAVGRFGGEEFLIVAPVRAAEQGADLARRIVQRIADTPIASSAGPLPVTVSVGGFCGILPSADAADAIIERADAALYQAKDRGRNRVQMCA